MIGHVVAGGLRFLCLLAVLAQYSPARLCALEKVVLGSSCHDQTILLHHGASEPESMCGSGNDRGDDHCICELPKQSGSQQHASGRVMVDWTHPFLGVAAVSEPVGPALAVALYSNSGPQRPPDAFVSLPLLT